MASDILMIYKIRQAPHRILIDVWPVRQQEGANFPRPNRNGTLMNTPNCRERGITTSTILKHAGVTSTSITQCFENRLFTFPLISAVSP